VAVLVLLGVSGHALAQRVSVVAGLGLSQSVTDNRNLSATDQRTESITTVSPNIRISSQRGRVTGALSYALNGIAYGRDSGANSVQNALSANFAAQIVERVFLIDGSANISQQSVSAFGLQSSGGGRINPNSAETRSYSLSPSVQGQLFGDVSVQARLSTSGSSSAGIADSRRNTHTGSVNLGENVGRFGWGLDASRTVADFAGGRESTGDRAGLSLFYTPDPSWRFFVRGGEERQNVQTLEATSTTNYGGGVTWQPGPRTSLSLQTERRFFGDSHSLAFSHRFRRAAISYADSRSVSESTTGGGAAVSTYDLFFLQFASLEPDPVLRDRLVRDFLAAAGLDTDERQGGGFLTTALSVQRTQNLSLSVQGLRNTLVMSGFASNSRRVDRVSGGLDDLTRVDRVKQQGLSVSLSHRLTPRSAMVLSGSASRTPSTGPVLGNSFRTVSLSWNMQVAQSIAVTASARHSQARGANPYDENVLNATLNLSF